MRSRKTICALGVLAVLGSAWAQRVKTRGAAAEEIARLLEVHRTDYLKGDADAWAALYAENAVFAGGTRSVEGRPAIREYFAQVFKDFPTRTANVSHLGIRVYNETATPTAIINVENDATRTDASGGQVILNSRESLVWVKMQGKWLIVDHHTSSRLNPSGPAQVAPIGAQAPSGDQLNREVVQRFFQKENRGDVRGAGEEWAERDARNEGRPITPELLRAALRMAGESADPSAEGKSVVREVFRLALEDLLRTFPDWHWEIDEILAAGDSVVVRARASGTHRGVARLPMNGGMLAGVQPTGKRVEFTHIHWLKLRDGKIVDHYVNRDDLGMMKQLGLVPGTPTAGPR